MAVRVVNGLVNIGLRRTIVRIIKAAIADLRHDLVVAMYGVSRQFHGRADTSDLHTRIVQDSERLDNLGNAVFSAILPALLSAIVLLTALFVMSASLTLMMIAVAPAIWLALRVTARRVRRDVRVFQRAFESFSHGIQFVLRQMELTRIQAQESREIWRQDRIADTLRTTGHTMAMSFAVHGQGQQMLMAVAGAVILVAGGAQVANGAMSLGELLSFYVAAGLLNGVTGTVLGGVADLVAGMESVAAIKALMEAGPREPYMGTCEVVVDGHVSLRHVAFDYGGHPVLGDVSLEIEPDARTAIVGPNGAGKTTLLNLIVGLERPKAGTICAQGVPYDALDMRAFRRQVGVVTQGMTLFSATIRDNIGYGHPDATLAEIIDAARRALAHAFITALPAGYDTQVGEAGSAVGRRMPAHRDRPRAAGATAPARARRADQPPRCSGDRAVGGMLASLEDRPAILMISHDPRVMSMASRVYRLERGVLDAVVAHEPEAVRDPVRPRPAPEALDAHCAAIRSRAAGVLRSGP